ncbi:immunity 49 family protein [Amycolatopsis benzoatilytica]|uniref:immunity 49 family protein n=1 Tax=Amycolatopsis benzoatilytica TaxID=346045 RepID=UPI000380EC51|nr:immunity 49 family protein [Amycolatopsis benzoatilytica]
MTIVERHPADPDQAWKQIMGLSPEMGYYLDRVAANTAILSTVWRRALTLGQYRTVVDPVAAEAETWDDLNFAAQAAAAVFTAATAPEGEEVSAVVGRPLTFQATGPSDDAHAGAWVTAAWLAVLQRDDALIQRLAAVPLEVLRASGVEHDSYLMPWVETLQTFLAHREVTPEMFLPAMDGTDPETAQFTPPDAMLQLVYPPIRMFYYVLRRDSEKFAEAYVAALERHRAYWTAEGRETDPSGFLALAPLAVAVLARTVGMTFDVQSGYAPANLLSGVAPVRND